MKTFSLILVCMAFSACSGNEPDAVREETVGTEIADGYNQQMQRARDVEIQLDQQKRDLDAAIESSEEGRRQP